jgi:hypothetical protein
VTIQTAPASLDATPAATSHAENVLRFLATAAQFAALAALVWLYQLETAALRDVMLLAAGGFVVHHFLPGRLQLPFFALLSVSSIALVLGLRSGGWIIAVTTLLVAVCHYPIPFAARVAVIAAAAGGLAFARARDLLAVDSAVWPILGSMLMFRLAVYLYDLKHQSAPFSPWHAAAYFAMIPNAAFTLFPVVDYKTFCRSRFNDDAFRIYQTGIRWMLRGMIHLLMYRIIYQNLLIDPAFAVTLGDALQYAITTFFLYLRISGTFHLIVGMLHMFGFNLPETHHLYYLSSSFTDFWRRINIYWKDFITKLVFYPVYFRIRKIGERRAMLVATLVAFAATWALHSWQWFWIRGRFPIAWQDLVFWFALALLVMISMRREARDGRERRLTPRTKTLRSESALTVRTVGMFAALCILWTVWSTPSSADLRTLLRAAANVDVRGVVVLALVALVVAIAAVVAGRFGREQTGTSARPDAHTFWRSVRTSVLWCGVLVTMAVVPGDVWPTLAEGPVTRLREPRLNTIDEGRLERGYYEELADVSRFADEVAALNAAAPADWGQDPARRRRGDFLVTDHHPNAAGTYKGAWMTTNSWGMRDREYARKKPAGVYRIALVGSSIDMGYGVGDGEVYSTLVEERLNRLLPETKVEILNFAVAGYSPFQKLATVEQKVLDFEPDALFYAVQPNEFQWMHRNLNRVPSLDLIPYAPLREALEENGIDLAHDDQRLEPILRRYARPHQEFVLNRVAEIGRRHRMPVYMLLVPNTYLRERPVEFEMLERMATEAGLRIVDLSEAFDDVSDRSSLYLTPFDRHPNRRGHRLLAERLERELRDRWLSDMRPANSPRQRPTASGAASSAAP